MPTDPSSTARVRLTNAQAARVRLTNAQAARVRLTNAQAARVRLSGAAEITDGLTDEAGGFLADDSGNVLIGSA